MFWKNKPLYFLLIGLMVSLAARADGPAAAAPQAGAFAALSNPFVWTMIVVILFLVLVIRALANVLLNAARKSRAEEKAEAGNGIDQGKGVPAAMIVGILLLGSLFLSRPVMAGGSPGGGDAAAGVSNGAPAMASVAVPVVNGLSNDAFYMIVAVIGVEILVILYLLYNINMLLKADGVAVAAETAVAGKAEPAFSFSDWWTKVNRFRPITEEEGMDMGHDYDGIRELDNKLPPWWKYGFYATMIFAVVYLWRYHVAHAAPLQDEEYAIAVEKAAVQKEAYLKMAANNVDESTVKLLTGQADLAAGKAIFTNTCFACHGKNGEGGVGPNLTDSYWLHGGSIQEVFKTIKYGWPDKGMKSWKDDFSPSQIAQIASYVKSLAGTNPPNGKAPQGTLVK